MNPRPCDLLVGEWGARFGGRRFPCAIGRGGIAVNKVEGDGVTPAGVWHLVGGGYHPGRMARPQTLQMRLTRNLPFDVWSDDVDDPDYNHGFHAPEHPFSHERLTRADPLYNLILFSDWNWPVARAGKGSAIFIHAWRKPRHPTEGCIAFDAAHLRWILARWSNRSRVIVKAP